MLYHSINMMDSHHDIIMPGAFTKSIKEHNMAKIKRSDIISDEALKAPAELAKGLKESRAHIAAIQKQLGWYPKNNILAIKKELPQEKQAVNFGFVMGLLIGVIVGLTAGIITCLFV